MPLPRERCSFGRLIHPNQEGPVDPNDDDLIRRVHQEVIDSYDDE